MIPAPFRWRIRFRVGLPLAAVLALGWLALPAPALALDVELGPPRMEDGYVWADIRLEKVFSPRVEGSLARGMPATFQFHAELWRRRGAWFDKLESSFEASVKVRYEVWNKAYRLDQRDRPPISVSTLDSVAAIFSRPLGLPVARSGSLQDRSRYYLVVSVTLKPLSVEDIEEGEGWLSGEVETKRGAGFGIITAIPRAVFDAVRNFAGFGDQRGRAMSEEFRADDLKTER